MPAPFPQGKSQQVFLTIFLNNIWGGMPGYKLNTCTQHGYWTCTEKADIAAMTITATIAQPY